MTWDSHCLCSHLNKKRRDEQIREIVMQYNAADEIIASVTQTWFEITRCMRDTKGESRRVKRSVCVCANQVSCMLCMMVFVAMQYVYVLLDWNVNLRVDTCCFQSSSTRSVYQRDWSLCAEHCVSWYWLTVFTPCWHRHLRSYIIYLAFYSLTSAAKYFCDMCSWSIPWLDLQVEIKWN